MYQSFIGLEIHIQLLAKTKVFCGCRAAFGDEPNTNVCPVCMGYPGVLPALNREAIRMAYVVARALNCKLEHECVFDRKNYYYPDLPKNYQISQFGTPVARDGYMDIKFHGNTKRVRIHDVHLEEDAGKMIHAGDMSLLDFNRAGTPLLEIVTEPDLEIGEEAEVFLQNFRRMVRYLGVCDGNMEEGSLRCDANVSVNLRGKGLGSKVEIKNMNSSRFVRKALSFEIERHTDILEKGGSVPQETRLWNENRDLSEAMRTKEEANDYRYFPDPDLPPFTADEQFLSIVDASLVELPLARKERMCRDYGLPESQADFLCDEKERADFFEETVHRGAEPAQVASWMGSDVAKLLNRTGVDITSSPLTPARLASLLGLLQERRIHGKIAKQVLEAVFEEDKSPETIIDEKGWEQITDRSRLGEIVDQVMDSNPKAVESIRSGDAKPMGFLVGQVMKVTSGRAEPQMVQEILKERFAGGLIDILSMGGAIGGRVEEGIVVPGDIGVLEELLRGGPVSGERVRFGEIETGRILSEEIVPEDWAALISTVADRLSAGDSDGIVITHGTDTLSFTASLLFWFFADTSVPIIFAASVGSTEKDSRRAATALQTATAKAAELDAGVYVMVDGRMYSPLNLKFERVADEGFRNWNMNEPVFTGRRSIPEGFDFDRAVLRQRLEEAVNRVFISRIFPGMKGEALISLIQAGYTHFVLETYDSGTANLRESPYSLRKAFLFGRDRDISFFCTSQQEDIVDFSEYITSHELWKEGAVPMRSVASESAYTRLIASLVCEDENEAIVRQMEEADAYISG